MKIAILAADGLLFVILAAWLMLRDPAKPSRAFPICLCMTLLGALGAYALTADAVQAAWAAGPSASDSNLSTFWWLLLSIL